MDGSDVVLAVVTPDKHVISPRLHADAPGIFRRNAVKERQHGGIRRFLDVLDNREGGFRAVMGKLKQHQRIRLALRRTHGIRFQPDDQRHVPAFQRHHNG